jgi:hypothetical protein
MTVTPLTERDRPDLRTAGPSTRTLLRTGALAGSIAAICTTLVAAGARAAGVDLEIDGTPVPLLAFAWWTLVGATLGVVLARFLGARRRFVIGATVATGLSLVPAIAAPDEAATAAVLVTTHLLAAAIVVPPLARLLARPDR